MAASEWLKDLQRAAQETAQREQRGEQLTLGDLERTPDEPRTKPVQGTAAPAAEPRPNRGKSAHAAQTEGRANQAHASAAGADIPGDQIPQKRDYRRIYRALFDFHERHNPPRAEAEYWATVSADMEQTAAAGGDDPFLMDLLVAVFAELEREAAAQGGG